MIGVCGLVQLLSRIPHRRVEGNGVGVPRDALEGLIIDLRGGLDVLVWDACVFLRQLPSRLVPEELDRVAVGDAALARDGEGREELRPLRASAEGWEHQVRLDVRLRRLAGVHHIVVYGKDGESGLVSVQTPSHRYWPTSKWIGSPLRAVMFVS